MSSVEEMASTMSQLFKLSTRRWRSTLLLVFFGVAGAAMILWGAWEPTIGFKWRNLGSNLGTELVGALLVYALFDRTIERLRRDRAAFSEIVRRLPGNDLLAQALPEA